METVPGKQKIRPPIWAVALWLAATPIALTALLLFLDVRIDQQLERGTTVLAQLSGVTLIVIWLYVSIFVFARRIFSHIAAAQRQVWLTVVPLVVAAFAIVAGFGWMIAQSDTCNAVGWYLAWDEDNARYPAIVRQRTQDCRSPVLTTDFEGVWMPGEYGAYFEPSSPAHRPGRLEIDIGVQWAIADKFLMAKQPPFWNDEVRIRFKGTKFVDPRNPDAPPTYLIGRILDAQWILNNNPE